MTTLAALQTRVAQSESETPGLEPIFPKWLREIILRSAIHPEGGQ